MRQAVGLAVLMMPSGQHQQRLAHVADDVGQVLARLLQLRGALGDLLLQRPVERPLLLDQPEVGADLVDQKVVVDGLEQVVDRADGEAALLELLGLEGGGQER
jgi:hypothetical protein